MKKIFVLLIVNFLSALAFAATGSKISVEGYVTGFDNETIIIESGSQKIDIPKKMYQNKVMAGELISVEMSQSDFKNLKKENIKSKSEK
ncbi:MAG: hypothetical protein JSU04_03130 [Bdellovibrionales bacterium]|nr:hypothetical protein [Bdellovibrionales bacterium]